LHSINSFEKNNKYNNRIQDWLLLITRRLKTIDAKREFIKHKVNFLQNKDVHTIAKQVDKMTQNKE
jgi:hypothetical protein